MFSAKLLVPWLRSDVGVVAVKGSKQHQMVVVPHRPYYKAWIFFLFLAAMMTFSWSTYRYGLAQGLETKIDYLKEKEALQQQLSESERLIQHMRQEVAELKISGQIDSKATEEVQITVGSMQDQIAALEKEISFYKGVMIPNVDEKGLRIERLEMKALKDSKKYSFSLLLTQIVQKHEYIQGKVKINLIGQQGNAEKQYSLSELNGENDASIAFRFRYFQNIDTELTLPEEFEPTEVMIVAQTSGRNSQRLEKKFDWQRGGD